MYPSDQSSPGKQQQDGEGARCACAKVLVLLPPSAVERQEDPRLRAHTGRAIPHTSSVVLSKSLNFSDPQGFLLKMGAEMYTSRLMWVRFRPGWMTRDVYSGQAAPV